VEVALYKEKLVNILNLDQFEKLEQKRKNAKELILKEEERINKKLKELHKSQKISSELL
jgi:hypothetical protein